MNIGSNIKALRISAGLTQEQLAGSLGVSFQAVSKWETSANTPDIQLLPQIAKLFCISIDALFADDIGDYQADSELIKDDDVFRVVQFRGRRMVRVQRTFSKDCPPIEIAFPRNCNDSTQYFKVEVYGHVIADGSINGDVVCHGNVQCSELNGELRCDGDVRAGTINSSSNIKCRDILECYKLTCADIQCETVEATSLSCQKIVQNNSK